ncbi:MAG: LemA family protein [Wenzhouxiangella sp.]
MEWLPLIFLLAVLAWAVWSYNRLVVRRNRVATAWSDIDVQLTRRHDLVPNLVRVVARYTDHERVALEKVTRLRSEALRTDSPGRLGVIEDELEQLLGRLLVLKEDYPDLRASENFAQLSRQLVEVEEHLVFARRYYNGAVRDLNTTIEQVPDLIIARLFRFRPAEFYAAEAAERVLPKLESRT